MLQWQTWCFPQEQEQVPAHYMVRIRSQSVKLIFTQSGINMRYKPSVCIYGY